jgi:hypothetical protein
MTVVLSSSMKKVDGHFSLKPHHYFDTHQRLKDALDRSIPYAQEVRAAVILYNFTFLIQSNYITGAVS